MRYVILSGGDRRKVRRVHHLVLEAFVGPCPVGLEGCHWDDDKDTNHLNNLRWDTHGANMNDAVRNGNHFHGSKNHCPTGHEYTPENTKLGKNGGRWCRECHRIDARKRYHENLEGQREYRKLQQRRSRAKRKSQ